MPIDRQLDLLGWSAEKTAQAIMRAIAVPSHRLHYIVTTGGNLLVFMMNKILPTWVRDIFGKRFYGIHQGEKSGNNPAK